MSCSNKTLHVLLMTAKGGGEKWYSELIPKLTGEHIFVSHNPSNDNFLDDIITNYGYEIIRAPSRLNLFKYSYFWCRLFYFNKIKTLHTNIYLHSYVCLFFAKMFGVKNRIFHIHSSSIGINNNGVFSFISKAYENISRFIILKTATHIFYVSNAAKNNFSHNNRLTSFFVPPAIDLNLIREYYVKRDKKEKFIVSIIGRLYISKIIGNPKNHDFVLQLANSLKHNSLIEFHVVGDGPAFEYYFNLAQEMRLNNIKFIGQVDDVYCYYSRTPNLILSPSIHEGFGLTVIESQLYGLPVITSDNVPCETLINKNLHTVIDVSSCCSIDKWKMKIEELSLLDIDYLSESKVSLDKVNNTMLSMSCCSKFLNEFYLNG
ncbi:TPA: glycosyltransferase [Photobacterium damselae]